MKKFWMFLAVCLLMNGTVWADLSISPFYVVFDADSPKRTASVRFTNAGLQTRTYRIKLINYRQEEDGRYTPITEALPNNPFAEPYLNYAPHETTLAPGQSQTVRIQRKPMAAAKDGEYVSHLMIQEMPDSSQLSEPVPQKELKIDIKALYGMTIPLMIEKGALTNNGAIQSVEINPQKNEARVWVARTGTQSFWGTLIVKDGQKEIGRLNEFKIFLSVPRRLLVVPLTQKPSGSLHIILKNARTDETVAEETI